AVVTLLQQRLHALAELSELRMRTFASEEVAAQLLFELPDGTGERRLCYVALFRGAREIKCPCHRQEIANLVLFASNRASLDNLREQAKVLRKRFPQVELNVSKGIPLERAEHLVAESLIKRPGLKAVCLERGPNRAPRASVSFCILHKPCSMSCTARCLSDPEMSHLQPASPELAEHPAKHITAPTAQDKVDREIVGKASSADIVVVDAVHDELSHPFIDERLELDAHRLHKPSRIFSSRLTLSIGSLIISQQFLTWLS